MAETDEGDEWVLADEEPACQVCGCTDAQACEGGCMWVTPTLCSRCAQADTEEDDAS